ncbi:MAG: hypothetical protein K1W35_12975 [Lachnospiraceae bacterium]
MFYCVSIMMLGYTRINGVVAYNSKGKCFDEITPAIARQLISKNMLKGIKWKNNDDKGEFICDVEGWNQQNIPIKTACGKFRPMLNDVPGVPINSMCTVVRVLDTEKSGRLYEIVSNKCMRLKVGEKNLRELNEISSVAGVWITDDEIILAEGVKYEDRRASSVIGEVKESLASEKNYEAGKSEEMSMEDIFGAVADDFMKVPEENAEEQDTKEEEANKEDAKEQIIGEEEGMMPPIFEDKAPVENKAAEREKKTTSKRKRK